MAHEEWAARLGRMRVPVAQWMKRTSGDDPGSLKVEPGSSLAGDDRIFPNHPVSSVAWHGLLTAVEHLDFALSALAKTQTLYPASYYTVLRAGLLGAAQTVWVLMPATRTERQMRGLRAAADNYNEQRKLTGALVASTRQEQQQLDMTVARMKDRLADVATAAVKIGCDPGKAHRLTLDATAMVKEAAGKALVSAHREQEYAMHLWRLGSGHAHGHAYTRQLQINAESLTEEADGQLWARTTVSLEHVGTAAAAVLLMTKKGFEMYDQRHQSHL